MFCDERTGHFSEVGRLLTGAVRSASKLAAYFRNPPVGRLTDYRAIALKCGLFRPSPSAKRTLSGHVFATREGREKHFVARKDQWRFLLTWDVSENPAFPHWVPWAVVFTLIERFHALTSSEKFATYSDDLQAIEFNRVLAPLLARLASEGYRTQDFAAPATGRSAEHLMPKLQHLVRELME